MSDDEPSPKRVRLNFLDTFEVIVGQGPNEKSFTVHDDILTRRSDFFRAARSDRWTQDSKKPADLQHDDPDLFATYLHCVYKDEVILSDTATLRTNSQSTKKAPKSKQQAAARFTALINLFVFADRMGDPLSANLAIDEIMKVRSETRHLPSAQNIRLAYDSTLKDNPLRLLLIEYYVFEAPSLPNDDFPKQFLRDVVENYLDTKRKHTKDEEELLEWSPSVDAESDRYHMESPTI